MPPTGASGKDTSNFLTEIAQNSPPLNSSGSNTFATMDDIPDRSRRNTAISARNKYREDRRAIEGQEGDISDNEELIPGDDESKIEPDKEPGSETENTNILGIRSNRMILFNAPSQCPHRLLG
jgi:hypothetical protein